MFSYLTKDGVLALRLPPQAREDFLKRYKTSLVEAYGIVQKEYVAVPGSLLKKTKELQKYFALSYDYVKGLKQTHEEGQARQTVTARRADRRSMVAP